MADAKEVKPKFDKAMGYLEQMALDNIPLGAYITFTYGNWEISMSCNDGVLMQYGDVAARYGGKGYFMHHHDFRNEDNPNILANMYWFLKDWEGIRCMAMREAVNVKTIEVEF